MSTPAAAVLDGAGSGTAGAAGSAGAGAAAGAPTAGGSAGAGASPGAGQPPASNEGFWKDWTAPEQKETRDWIANKNYADSFTLAKTAHGLEKEAASLRSAVSLKGYPVDKTNPDGSVVKADENQVKAWNTTMGVPETADKYDLFVPALNPYPQFKEIMAKHMLNARVPAALATVMSKEYDAAIVEMETAIRAQEDAATNANLLELERAWGSQYKERYSLAGRHEEWMAKEVGLTDDMRRTMRNMLGMDKYMTYMWKIGAANKEASFAGGGGAPPPFSGGASEAQAQYNQLQADRAAGKVSTEDYRKRETELANIIAGGFAH